MKKKFILIFVALFVLILSLYLCVKHTTTGSLLLDTFIIVSMSLWCTNFYVIYKIRNLWTQAFILNVCCAGLLFLVFSGAVICLGVMNVPNNVLRYTSIIITCLLYLGGSFFLWKETLRKKISEVKEIISTPESNDDEEIHPLPEKNGISQSHDGINGAYYNNF